MEYVERKGYFSWNRGVCVSDDGNHLRPDGFFPFGESHYKPAWLDTSTFIESDHPFPLANHVLSREIQPNWHRSFHLSWAEAERRRQIMVLIPSFAIVAEFMIKTLSSELRETKIRLLNHLPIKPHSVELPYWALVSLFTTYCDFKSLIIMKNCENFLNQNIFSEIFPVWQTFNYLKFK